MVISVVNRRVEFPQFGTSYAGVTGSSEDGRIWYGTIPRCNIDQRGMIKKSMNGFQMLISFDASIGDAIASRWTQDYINYHIEDRNDMDALISLTEEAEKINPFRRR